MAIEKKLNSDIEAFLSQYDPRVMENFLIIRKMVLEKLPDVQEQLDLPARMIGYCYGQKYSELVCTIFPSKKGLKLGFNRGNELKDPEELLKGTGKISRYVELNFNTKIISGAILDLLGQAYLAYKERMLQLGIK